MKPTPGVWGIDLGQCGLKAIRLQEIEGQVVATAFDYVEYPKILSQPDAEPDQLIREALDTFLSRNSLRGDTVAISVPGQSGLARFVKLPPVEEKKIADIVRFEAKQQIPFNLEEVVWDYQKIGSSNVVDGFALETEIGLFAMKRDMVNRYLQHFKDVGVEVHVVQMAPLALCNFLAYDLLARGPGDPAGEKKNCVVALDIGTDSSNLVITDADRVIWQRPIPLGGNHFTRALTKDLKLTFAKAEHLKRNATKPVDKTIDLKKILASLKPVLNDFVGEVQRSLGYFTNTHRDAQIDYLVGLGNAFRLPGLQRFMAEKLQLEVRKLAKMERLSGDVLTSPVYTENILSFGVAYGLALQALQQGRIATNLLPGEIRVERLVRAKKPMAVAAAGILLLGLAAIALGNYLDDLPYSHPRVKKAVETADGTAKKAAAAEAAFTKAQGDARREEEAVKAIVAGQQERLNWIKLLTFIGEVVPQPNGRNLPPDPDGYEPKKNDPKTALDWYWRETPTDRRPRGIPRVSGKEAYEEYKKRALGGRSVAKEGQEKPRDDDPLPFGIDDLIQFKIRSVDSRYCEDLKTFWEQITKLRQKGDVRPQEHYDKELPKGSGWVIELKGYTHHHKHVRFVRDTLLTNIARLGIPPKPPEPAPGTAAPAGKPETPPAGKANPGKPAAPPADKAAPGKPSTPAKPPAAAPPGKADAAKPGQSESKPPEEPTKEPVLNHVSHVVLFKTAYYPYTEGAKFEILNVDELEPLLTGSAKPAAQSTQPAGGMPTGPATQNKGGPGRDAWRPLGASGNTSVGRGIGDRGMGDEGTPGTKPKDRSPAGAGAPPPGKTPAKRPTTPPADGEALHTRTEFIIFFIWQEPTPSDDLRGEPGKKIKGPAVPAGAGK